MEASVVIPAHNARDTIREQLEALSRQLDPRPTEIIVVDDGSTDDTGLFTTAVMEDLNLPGFVLSTDGVGAAAARNVGAAATNASLLLFCDADDVVRDDWCASMVDALGEGDVVAGEMALDVLNAPGPRLRMPSPGPMRMLGFLPFGLGANCGVRREAFDRVRGFNPRFDNAGEDVDLFWRLQLAGYTFVWAPGAVVEYRLRGTTRAEFRQLVAYERAKVRLYGEYRGIGIEEARVVPALVEWGRLGAHSGRALDSGTRARWLARVATRWGRLSGTLRERVLYL